MRPLYDLTNAFAAQIQAGEREANRRYDAVIGVVCDNKDPQKLGRVKVKFPTVSTQDTTWWCPLVMLGAGKNRGWFFIPELEDEVICMFEHGDPDRPIVIGALWNGKDKPPDKNPGGNPRRVIKSRQGSRIVFDDENEQLIIEDGAGKGRITLDSKANKIRIEAIDGDVCLQSPNGDMTLVAKTAEIGTKMDIEVHSGQAMQLGTDASAKINSSAGVTMSGTKVNLNGGTAQMPPTASTSPQSVKEPYGS